MTVERFPFGLSVLRRNVIIGKALYAQGEIIADGKRWRVIAIGDERAYLVNSTVAENQKASIPLATGFQFLRGKFRDQASSELQHAQD